MYTYPTTVHMWPTPLFFIPFSTSRLTLLGRWVHVCLRLHPMIQEFKFLFFWTKCCKVDEVQICFVNIWASVGTKGVKLRKLSKMSNHLWHSYICPPKTSTITSHGLTGSDVERMHVYRTGRFWINRGEWAEKKKQGGGGYGAAREAEQREEGKDK